MSLQNPFKKHFQTTFKLLLGKETAQQRSGRTHSKTHLVVPYLIGQHQLRVKTILSPRLNHFKY